MTPTSGANERNPTHHITLSDGSTTVGLMLVSPNGMDDPHAITAAPYPRTSLQIGTGSTSKYEDYVPPYSAVVQDSFVGGRGQDIFEEDKTRYADNYRTETTIAKNVVLGPLDFYARGNDIRKQDYHLESDDLSATNGWLALYGSTLYCGKAFTAGSSYTSNLIEFKVRRVGTPGIGTVAIYTNSGGAPGSVLAYAFLQPSEVPDIVTVHIYKELNVGATITSGSTYWAVIAGNPGDNANNHWEVLCKIGASSSAAKTSSDGSVWSNSTYWAYFRICERVLTNEADGFFFDYKSLKYFVTKSGEVYRNGIRGVADNTSTTTTLDDSSLSMTPGQFADAILIIVKGRGSEETQPYRRIYTNTATQFQFAAADAWLLAPDTTTEYAVKDTPYWSYVTTLPQTTVKGVAVADEVVYFCHGRGKPITYLYEYNASGTWTVGTGTGDLTDIDAMITTRHPVDGLIVWAARNTHAIKGSVIYKCFVPPLRGDLFRKHGTLIEHNRVWNHRYTPGVTQTFNNWRLQIGIGAGVPAGSIVAEKELDSPIDFTGSTRIFLGMRSDIAQSAGDIQFLISDRELSRSFTPDYIISAMRQVPPTSVFFRDDSAGTTEADKWFPLPQVAYDPAGQYQERDGRFELAQTADRLYIGCPVRFDRLDVYFVNATVNNNAATLVVEFWNGTSWEAVSGLSDGTASGGATLAQNGAITWTRSTYWQQGCHLTADDYISNSLFWVRIGASAALDPVDVRIRARYTNEGGATLETIDFKELTLPKDGDTATYQYRYMWDSLGHLYIGFSELFNKIYFDLGTSVNSTASTLSAQYFNGSSWTSLSITDGTASGGATMAQDGEIVFTTPVDWEKNSVNGKEAYWVRLSVSNALGLIDIREINVKQEAAYVMDFPAMTAGENQWIALTINHVTSNLRHPDMSRIKFFGLKYNRSAAAATLTLVTPIIYGGPATLEDSGVISVGSSTENITGMEAYGDERQNAWVFREGTVGEIQAENNDAFVPIPLQELSTFYSSENAKGHTTNDVYLYWTMGGMRVERYYNRTLENLGPDKDEGLPAERQGTIRQLISMPGEVLAGIDAGPGRISSILRRTSSGWHELYRFPTGQRFWRMSLDVCPDERPSRLWIACGAKDMKFIQISKVSENPTKDNYMYYTNEGTVITSWISSNLLDVDKLFSFLTLNTKNLGTHQKIAVDYQIDDGSLSSGWTEIGTFDTSPWQTHEISSSYNVRGNLIRLRFRLITNQPSKTPILKAYILDQLLRLPVKYSFVIRFRLRDNDVDMRNIADPIIRAEDKLNILSGWSTSLTVLTMRCLYSLYDNKKVFLEPISGKPYGIVVKDNLEYHIYEATLLEV